VTGRPFDAVLVVAFGGPEGMGDVRPFLANVIRGRRVAPKRIEEVAKHYEHFGGVSPLAAITRRQVEGLKAHLAARGLDVPIYLGMRNWHPLLPDTLKTMAQDGVRHAIGFVCAAHRSYSSCTQYRENVVAARQAAVEAGLSDVSVTYVGDWHHHDRFIEVNARHVRAALDTLPAPVRSAARLVFTAHSIPVAMAGAARYRAQLLESSRLVAERLGVADWALVFQSRSGRPEDPWLEPDVCHYPSGGTGPRPRRGGDLSDRVCLRPRRGAVRPGHRSSSGVPRRRLADREGGHGERRSAVSRDDGRRGAEDLGSLSHGQAVVPVDGDT
jgi:protoporphyrin/coproporphyrin ferrochelatase